MTVAVVGSAKAPIMTSNGLTILSVPVPKITIKDCYILKMVIQGYFMSSDRLLFEMLKTEIIKSGLKIKEDVEPILYM